MIIIDSEKCTGCGKCVSDCFPGHIGIKDAKASVGGLVCMECGHCIAVCPSGAVSAEEYDMGEVLELKNIESSISPEIYLNHLKGRRSIRKFKKTSLTSEQTAAVIEAGRYSPTGGNLQNVSYFVSCNEISAFRDMLYEELKALGTAAENSGNSISWYSKLWLKMYDEFRNEGKDKLFFDAPTVIVVSSNSPQSALIAASHMETMIYSLGLGMLYSGFTERAIMNSEKLKKYISLKEGYSVYAVLVVGEPDVRYSRTVPRKPADVIWK